MGLQPTGRYSNINSHTYSIKQQDGHSTDHLDLTRLMSKAPVLISTPESEVRPIQVYKGAVGLWSPNKPFSRSLSSISIDITLAFLFSVYVSPSCILPLHLSIKHTMKLNKFWILQYVHFSTISLSQTSQQSIAQLVQAILTIFLATFCPSSMNFPR